jgi:putative phosphoesterase
MPDSATQMNLGLISDTHGLLRREALDALRGSDLIVHAGDIGAPAVLDALRAIAPLVAVRGNNDSDAWAQDIPETTPAACACICCTT